MIKYKYNNFTQINDSIFNFNVQRDPSDSPIMFLGNHKDYANIDNIIKYIKFSKSNDKKQLYFGYHNNDMTNFYVQILNMINIPVVSNYKFENCLHFDNTTTYKNSYKPVLNVSNKKLVIDFLNNFFSDDIKFNIITPTYNSIKYLPKCIKSVQNQLYKNYTHYICDDCSTDGTQKYLKDLSDNQIKSNYLSTNKGAYFARNTLLYMIKPNEASQNYFCILDADDVFEKYRLMYDVLAISVLGELDGIQSKYIRYTEDNIEVISSRYGMNSISYNYKILNEIGKFWDTRVSGDSEFYRRFNTKYKMTQYDLKTVNMFVRNDGQNLTILHPYADAEYYTKLKNVTKINIKQNNKEDIRKTFFRSVDDAYNKGNEYVYNLNKF